MTYDFFVIQCSISQRISSFSIVPSLNKYITDPSLRHKSIRWSVPPRVRAVKTGKPVWMRSLLIFLSPIVFLATITLNPFCWLIIPHFYLTERRIANAQEQPRLETA